MRLLVESGKGRRPVVERMAAIDPDIQIITDIDQPPRGATTFQIPHHAGEVRALVGEHRVDAFWSAGNTIGDLSTIGCAVHVPAGPDIVRLVQDGHRLADWLDDDEHRHDVHQAIGADGVAQALSHRDPATAAYVSGAHADRGWKLVGGGHSFLGDAASRAIDPEIWLAAERLAERDAPPRRVTVADWLPGPDVSVDVLCWNGQPLAHAARITDARDRRTVTDAHGVTGHARRVAERLSLHGIACLRYRGDDRGRWPLIGVDVGPGRECVLAEDAGFGIVTGWTRLLTGDARPDDIRQLEATRRLRLVERAVIQRS